MTQSSQPATPQQKAFRVVELTDEELQNMRQAGIPVRELRRALVQISDEDWQKMQQTHQLKLLGREKP